MGTWIEKNWGDRTEFPQNVADYGQLPKKYTGHAVRCSFIRLITCLHGENDEWWCYHPVGVSDIQVKYAGDSALASVAGTWFTAGIIRSGVADGVGRTHGNALTHSLASSVDLAPTVSVPPASKHINNALEMSLCLQNIINFSEDSASTNWKSMSQKSWAISSVWFVV